ncbi:hypothetical protein F4806DRAFT_443827 [Annulohypoxylon nitens]|nr:hypothetical protein F4806DRAFT_443827 [Annulohypoxylon nitens]
MQYRKCFCLTKKENTGSDLHISLYLPRLILEGVQLRHGRSFKCPYCRTVQEIADRFEWK